MKSNLKLLAVISLIVLVAFTAFSLNIKLIIEDIGLTAVNKSDYKILAPNASISGTTQVCRNETPLPQITFTGSAGDAPYTFTYTINGGAPQTVTTAGNNNSVTVNAPTGTAGTFTYALVSVEDSNGDEDNASGTAVVTVGSPPTVDFTFNNASACSGTPITFTPVVTGNGPFQYQWNFGDGGSSTQLSPTRSYNATGCGFTNFTARLTVTDSNGCVVEASKVINVEQRPNMEFVDLDAQFTEPFDNCGNNTTDPEYTVNVGNVSPSDSCIVSYDINWGDGSSETDITFPLSHTYLSLGSFNMTITGYGDSGCVSTETILVKNSSNPVGAIEIPGNTVNLCLPVNSINFSIGSWGQNPPDTFYTVNYGDGTVLTFTQDDLESSAFYNAANPAASQNFPIPHTYTDSNCPDVNYTVILNVTTSCGESILTAGPIIILKRPEVDFAVDPNSCVNTEVQFTNTSTDGFNQNCNTNAAFFWDFGDGNTSTLENPTHIYTSPGIYTVSLYAENFCGETDPISKTICIEPEIIADFSINTDEGCSPFGLTVNNTTDVSNLCGAETFEWSVEYNSDYCGTTPETWSFTNGTDENSFEPQFLFETAGIYTIMLTATNSCGSTTTQSEVNVTQPPIAGIVPIDDACGPVNVSPVANVQGCIPLGSAISYSWSFPGGTPATSNQLSPGTINYAAQGDYEIILTVTNDCGTVTTTQNFSINALPTITNTNTTQTICSGLSTEAILMTANEPLTTFTWTANAPPNISGFIATGTGDTIPAQTLINTGNTVQTLIYTVLPEIDGCIGDPVNFEIEVEPAPFIDNQPQGDAVCLNGAIADLLVGFDGLGTPTYQWYQNTVDNTTSGTLIAAATSAAYTPATDVVGEIYYYVVLNFGSGGCNELVSNTALVAVTPAAQIDVQPLNSQSICVDGIANELFVNVSNGAGTPNYQWFSNTTNSNTGGTLIPGATTSNYTPPSFLSAGTFYYYVEINYAASGCTPLSSEVSEIVVVEDPELTLQPIPLQELCQNTAAETLEVAVSGGLGNVSYQWYINAANNNTTGTAIAGETANSFIPTTATVGTFYYYVVVSQDVSGCEVTSDPAEVVISAGAQFSSQPQSQIICLGDTLADLQVSFQNGTGTPDYQWYVNSVNSNSGGTLIPGATAATFSPPANTVGTSFYYAVLTFNSGGCSEIISEVAEITINNTPNISNTDLLICSGNDFSYVPDESAGDVVPENVLYSWDMPTISPVGSITGGSAELTPISEITQTLTNTTLAPATVVYTITPISGDCEGNPFTVTVTVNPSISVDLVQQNNTCFESDNASLQISISGGVPFTTGAAYFINWAGPNGFISSDESISNLEAGTYTLTIEDDGGCPYSENLVITEPEILEFETINFNPDSISCFEANDGAIAITVSGGTQPYTYTWTRNGQPFSTDASIANLEPGTYVITVTDANNCGPITETFNLVEPPLLTLTLGNVNEVLCFGDATGAIDITAAGGRPDYTYNWIGPNGFSSADQNINSLEAGSYTVTVTDTSGCEEVLLVDLTQNEPISIDVSATEIACYGDNDASITINAIAGGVAPYAIAWSNFGTGFTQTNLGPGTYVITITDAENCSRDFPVIIEEPPLFVINPEVTQISCAGENDASIVLNFEGGVDSIDVTWSDDPNAGLDRFNLAPGTYSVIISDAQPCNIAASFTIFDVLPLQASAQVTDALDCDEPSSGAINLLIQGGTPPYQVVWSNGATTEDLLNIPPNTYTAQITDANGCTLQQNWEVIRFEPLILTVDTQSEVDCEAKTVAQTFIAQASGGQPPFTYNWSSGTVTGSNNQQMTTDLNGLVTVEVVDGLGCSTTFSLNVATPELGDPDFEVTAFGFTNFGVFSIQDPIQFTNTATGDYISVLWNFGDGSFSSEENPIHTYAQVGNYVVTQTVTYPFGCVYTNVVTLIIEPGYKLEIPDAFTPNTDGINDFFAPIHRGLQNLELNIYDTWGSLIYSESGDSIQGWDGNLRNGEAENGNYQYTFSAKTFYGDTINKSGAFVIIK
ncbi:PKD domain-containing protein [Paucihalobacter sp.]|uniref:PKD domain-containing protein n=1 Tax=Paucihalobacter sp. TaxID=2850405 RepID=UPI002FDFD549